MFPNQSPSAIPRVNKSKGSTPNLEEEKGSVPYVEKPTWAKCVRKHEGKCLVGMGNIYWCGKSGHMKKYNPKMKSQGRENAQAQDKYSQPTCS